MYTNTGYLKNADIDIVDLKTPLLVTSCGVYRMLHKINLCTTRPMGRRDYQLLYVATGKAYFYYGQNDEEVLVAPAGHMILYRPGEYQRYQYFLEDSPEVYWVHFTGYEADALLSQIGFLDTTHLHCGTGHNFQEIFLRMIRELQVKRPCHEEMLALFLRQLFTQMHRSRLEVTSLEYRYSEEMEETIHYFNEAFSQEISIEEYARSRHMSVCWFIRSFKRYMGMTPLQYITSIRINKAKELLKVTAYTVQEIGNIVGYDNPLYFSRIFRKNTGCSPSQYRENTQTQYHA